jgi:hypothetical protein
VNKLTQYFKSLLLLSGLLLSACSYFPAAQDRESVPEILTIFPDGSMRLMGRLVPEEDVVIYADGFGGEKAAIKVRLEPLRPAFYRDSIIVKRLDNESIANQ